MRLADIADTQRWFEYRLRQCLDDVDSVQVRGVDKIARGVSRETWTVDVDVERHGHISTESFVVRRDLPDGSVIPVPLREEFDVYRMLGESSLPTAKALWFEDDPRWQPDGREAYVRSKIDGTWQLPFMASDSPYADQEKIEASKEHLNKLAIVHNTNWRTLGFGDLYRAPSGPAECATDLLRDLESNLAGFQFEPNPLLKEVLQQLHLVAPVDSPGVSLCKGTNGYGEEIWSNGRIVAMSDWELCRLGDPAYDFAQLQDMVPEIVRDGRRLWGWPEALDYYASVSGIQISNSRLGFYRACYGLIQFLYAHHSAYRVRQGARSIRLMWNATEIQHHAQKKLVEALDIAHRMGGAE